MFSMRVSLKLQSRLSGGLGERLHAPVIEVSVAVEDDLFDLLLEADFRDQSSNLLGGVDLPVFAEGALEVARERRGCGEGLSVRVVDDLGVDVTPAPKHAEPRAVGPARD